MNRKQRRVDAKSQRQRKPAARAGTAAPAAPAASAASAVTTSAARPGLLVRLVAAVLLNRWVLARIQHPDAVRLVATFARLAGRDAAAEALERRGETPAAPPSARPAAATPAAARHLDRAIGLEKTGRLEQAAQNFRRAVESMPDDAFGHWGLGRTLLALGRLDEAEAELRHAVRLSPTEPEAHIALGVVLQRQGQVESAAAAYDRAIALDAGLTAGHCNLGAALRELGRLDEATNSLERALELQPDFAEAHNNLGTVRKEQGRLDEAAAAFTAAAAHKADYGEAHFNLGVVRQMQKRPADAVASFRRAIHLFPDHAEALINLGLALLELDKAEEAVAALRRAAVLDPDNAVACINLGNALLRLEQPAAAADWYRQAIALRPDFAEAHNNLANALNAQNQPDEAIALYRRALALHPDGTPGAMTACNLALVLQGQYRLDEVVAMLDSAIATAPDCARAHLCLGRVQHNQGRLDAAAASFRRALALDPGLTASHSSLLFSLLHHPGVDEETVAAEHRAFGARFTPAEVADRQSFPNPRDPDRALKIGFVSPDLFMHVVTCFFEPLLGALDRSQVEPYCYADVNRPDQVTERLVALAGDGHWRHTPHVGNPRLAEQIRADGIDILIDMAGHTADGRLPLFAGRAAPVQVAWLGYPATSGIAAMDYRIADRWTVPASQDRFFTEKIVRLPFTESFRPMDGCTAEPGPLPALARGHVTFCTTNRLAKTGDAVIAAWAAILNAVPGARLLFNTVEMRDPGVRAVVTARFAAAGAPVDRLDLGAGKASVYKDYLTSYREVDITLDPFPYNGGTTTNESLWMGVPVITLRGDRLVCRIGHGLLNTLGLPELVATTPDEYVAIAVALAHDLPRLAGLRATLRGRFLASPIGRPEVYAANLQAAWRQMWRRWCAGQLPEAFDIAPPPS